MVLAGTSGVKPHLGRSQLGPGIGSIPWGTQGSLFVCVSGCLCLEIPLLSWAHSNTWGTANRWGHITDASTIIVGLDFLKYTTLTLLWIVLKGHYYSDFQVHICILCVYSDMFTCFNIKKGLYFSHTACAAAPLFTLCLKPEPSLLWLVSWLCCDCSTA